MIVRFRNKEIIVDGKKLKQDKNHIEILKKIFLS